MGDGERGAMLPDKVCVVTGSTGGIGNAVARSFLRHGATVFVNGRGEDSVRDCLAAMARDGVDVSRAHGVAADVATAAGADALFDAVAAVTSRVDVLVNNVGVFEEVDFFELDPACWGDIFTTNVVSTVRMTQRYLADMLRRGSGRVIIVSSEAGFRGNAGMPHYACTKAAQINLARSLALLTKGTNVTVNALLPGPTMTDGVVKMVKNIAARTGKSEKEAEAQVLRDNAPTSLIARFLTPDEVANAATFLASDMSSGINGSAQRVEGGVIDTP